MDGKNHNLLSRTRRIIVPSLLQLLGCATVVVIMLTIVFWRVPLETLATLSGIDSEALIQDMSGHIGSIAALPGINYLGFILFWALVGAAAYIAFWILRAAYVDIRNDYILTHEFLNIGNPQTYHHRVMLKFGLAFVGLILLALVLFVVVPWCLDYIAIGIVPGATLEQLIAGLGALGLLIINIYLLMVWLQIVVAL